MKRYLFFILAIFFLAALGVGATPSPAHAAAALVQSAVGNAGTINGATSTLPNTTVAGDTIIVSIMTGTTNSSYYPSVPTDSQGNTYTQMVGTPIGYGSMLVWTATASQSVSDTVTLHSSFSASSYFNYVMEVSGIEGGTLDGVATSSCSSSPSSSGNISMASSGDFVLGTFGRDTSIAYAPIAPFVTAASSTLGGVEYRIMSASNVNPGATVSASASYPVEALTVAFPTTVPIPAPTITLDATSTRSGSPCTGLICTWSHTVGTGSDPVLIVTAPLGGWNGESCVPSCISHAVAVTYDGESLTQAVAATTGAYLDSEVWYLVNPPSGTHDISLTIDTSTANSFYMGAVSFFGVDQTTPIDAVASSTNDTGTATVSITPVNDSDWLVDTFELQNSNYALTTGARQTVIWKGAQYSFGGGASYMGPVSPASEQTFSWTGVPSGNYAVDVAVSLNPAPVYTTDTWVATSTGDWSVAGNWSTDSVPDSLQVALFSASSTADCVIDTSVSMGGIEIDAGYSGTITQSGANTINTGTKGYIQSDGTFAGGSGGITVGGQFTLGSGASFTSTSGDLVLEGSSDFSGTFNDNSGVVEFDAASSAYATLAGTASFNAFQFGDFVSGNNVGATIATGTVLTVQGNLSMSANSSSIQLLGGGEIDVQGNINGGTSAVRATGTATVALTGTGIQLVDNNSGHGASLYLPSLAVDKSSGLAVVTSSPVVTGSLALTEGELRLSSSTTAQTIEIDGALTVASGTVLSDYPSASSTITLGGSVTNDGAIFFDGGGNGCTAGLEYVTLQSTASGTERSWSGSGTFIIRAAGVKDQTGSASIGVLNGVNGGDNGGNWTFRTGPLAELVQGVASSGPAGTDSLNIPFGFWPRAGDLIVVAVSTGNQYPTAPTDSAGNTYTLIASSTFGASPFRALSLYYAKNSTGTSSPFSVQVNGTSSAGSELLSASVFEYTGMAPSTTLDTNGSVNTDASDGAVSLTSGGASGSASNELYFGAMTLDADTSVSSAAGWTQEAGITNNTTNQALYVEDLASISALTTAATWTSVASTSYAGILAIFHSPRSTNYPSSGSLDSATFDAQAPLGVQLNSVLWQGTEPGGTSVEFQFAVSNSASGPWDFLGPDGTSNTYFTANPGSPANLVSTTNGYALFSGYRYFRYRVTLFSDPEQLYTPTITGVTVNWSP